MRSVIWGILVEALAALGVLLSVSAGAGAAELRRTTPDPSLTPTEVVEIQMDALRQNDDPFADCGIEVTFNFASPDNKRMTGPLERFKQMVKTPIYAPMLGHRRADYENLRIEGDLAEIDVIVQSADGQHIGYHFVLRRQRTAPFAGSWMTDAVVYFAVTTL